jgi:DNA-binding transcriptional ArsR family regulator
MMTLSDLEQLKVLADPLRVRILEALGVERTTKQVAEEIGEKPTKLYHHVDALERVGLIKLTRTRRNRGTLEKYYQVVALSFRPDSSLFPQTGYTSTVMEVISNLLEKAESELQDLAACSAGAPDLEEKAMLSFVEVRAPEKEVLAIRAKLDALLNDLQKLADTDHVEKDAQRYRLMLGYYPLMKPPAAG